MANRPRLQRWNSAAALLALAASLPCAIRSEAEAAERDVLAGAFEYPFMTDAEVEFRLGDREADVRFERDSAMFRYPGIQAVFLDGQPAAAERLGPDLLRIWAPEGTRPPARPRRRRPRMRPARRKPSLRPRISPGAPRS